MNRVTVILVAIAIFVVHGLGVHQTPDGDFGPPYDTAHVAFRLARNLVHHGQALWNPGGELVESYPSPLWIGLCALAERTYASPTGFAQAFGMLAGLGTLVILAQHSAKRFSGLVAPLLLASSGSAVAAATSGTEAALVMLLVTASFLAFERRWGKILVLVLPALVLARPEGAFFCLALWLLDFVDRPRKDDGNPRPRIRLAFPFTAVLFVLLAGYRALRTGSFLSPDTIAILAFDGERFALGGHYFRGFFLASGSAPLLLLPLALLAFRMLPAMGRRALLLSAFWMLTIVAAGGDDLPMWNALAPALPLAFLSVQSAIVALIDRQPKLAPLAWILLALAVSASFLVSKMPGNLGPFATEELHREWMKPSPELERAYGRPLGRLGLDREIRDVQRLRALSIFLRDRIKASASILTLWPGAVGYLSRKNVYDMRGRATPLGDGQATISWRGAQRIDLLEALQYKPDYVVPVVAPVTVDWSPIEILRGWLHRYDIEGETEGRLAQLVSALGHYELISVPVSHAIEETEDAPATTYLLLRRKAMNLEPHLFIELDGNEFWIYARHRGHQQVADLGVWATDERGREWRLRPTGEFVRGGEIVTRVSLLLFPTGMRRTQLVHGFLPEGLGATRLSARLHNPGTLGASSFSAISPLTTLDLKD